MIAPWLVSALLNTYAPQMPKRVGAGIVAVESCGDSWAVGDNTSRRSYYPHSYGEGVALAHVLIAQGHSVDIGLAQVNSTHLGEPGVSIETMLDPARNLVESQRIFVDDLAATHGDLRAALSMYNSGSATASLAYADKVLAATSSSYGAEILGGQILPPAPPVMVRRAQAIGATFDPFRGSPW